MTERRSASRRIEGGQSGVHPRLVEVVARHRRHSFRRPVAAHTRDAFDRLLAQPGIGEGIILDAGCGTGESTLRLAERFPDRTVVGVDRSQDRLGRRPGTAANAIWLRADLVDFWRLLAASTIVVHRQYLFYPNPYPKAVHLGRRWHAHPVFPAIVACGGRLELRSNWRVYVDEMKAALACWEIEGLIREIEPEPTECVSPFERKYVGSGHRLWCLHARIPDEVAGVERRRFEVGDEACGIAEHRSLPVDPET